MNRMALTGVITSVPIPTHILDTGTEVMNFGDVLRWFGFTVSAKICFLRFSGRNANFDES